MDDYTPYMKELKKWYTLLLRDLAEYSNSIVFDKVTIVNKDQLRIRIIIKNIKLFYKEFGDNLELNKVGNQHSGWKVFTDLDRSFNYPLKISNEEYNVTGEDEIVKIC